MIDKYPSFIETSGQPERFFAILPPDWREGIAPHWAEYQNSARIFILERAGEVLGGGIVFSAPAPDTLAYAKEACRWFDRSYLYLGFLYIAEAHRGRRLGTTWLEGVRRAFPGRRFWLTVEEEGLRSFYERNGFRLEKEVQGAGGVEWLLAEGV